MAIPLPNGSPRCLCRSCGQYFTTVGNFDRHRRRGACSSPGSVGLVQVAGVWKSPNTRPTRALVRIYGQVQGAGMSATATGPAA